MEILEYFDINENTNQIETIIKHCCKTILKLLLNHALNELFYTKIDLVIDLVPLEKEDHYNRIINQVDTNSNVN